jgi:nucleotide-binding universal stress UspA family protein
VVEQGKRTRFKRFLIATDLSARAEKAMARAVQLADEHRAALTVVHILTGDGGRGTRSPRQVAVRIEEDLRRKVEALSRKKNGMATVRVLRGTPFVEITRQARDETADLILVGAHGKNFIKDLLFGATAEKIVGKGDRSVLVVKKPAQHPYRRVLAAVDFSDHSRRAMELGLRLAPQGEFHALHVYAAAEGTLKSAGVTESGIERYRTQVATDARSQLDAFVRTINRRGTPIRKEVWNGRPGREITRAASVHRADLVVIGTTGRTGIPYILLGSVAEHVMREAPCDVLVVRSGSVPGKRS